VTLTLSKVKVKVTGLLNFRQLAKPCMLAAMTAAPLRGFLVKFTFYFTFRFLCNLGIAQGCTQGGIKGFVPQKLTKFDLATDTDYVIY